MTAARRLLLAGAVATCLGSHGRPLDAHFQSCVDRPGARTLSDGSVETGTLLPGGSVCFLLPLSRGELVRIGVTAGRGYVRGRVLSPGGAEVQRTWASALAFAAPSPKLTIEAASSGVFVVELGVPTWVSFKEAQSFRVGIDSREPAPERAARRQRLQNDSRVAWLRANARTLRTLNPDADHTDLEFLRGVLKETRVVFLGEGDNGGGSDILAKTRLVKFLHDQMGFDVLAFQTPIYSSATDPGMPQLVARAAESDFLKRFVARAAQSRRSLVLTGFDSQFSGTVGKTLLLELRPYLRANLPDAVLLDREAVASRLLETAVAGGIGGSGLPTTEEQREAVATLTRDADRIGDLPGPDAPFWAQVMRSAASQLDLLLNDQRGAGADATLASLVRQLAANLKWLVEKRYAGRKIIVWSHSLHALRRHDVTRESRAIGFTVAEVLSDSLGTAVFSIGLTSYEGTSYFLTQPEDYRQSVIPDQDSRDSFETLMAAAGHQLAFVNLLEARADNVWPGGRFVGNALYLVPQDADWSRGLDALLFIKTQEPRTRAK